MALRKVNVIRYITPLREGGSMPAIAEADDGFLYVVKFRGAGQGIKALIAELIGGEIARALGLKVPEIVFAELDEAFGRTEGDEEIQDLLKASTGLNLALHFLSGAITYDPLTTIPDAMLASKIVWLDAYLMNMDRTTRNTNILNWHKEIWLIDHGAALYFHHSGNRFEGQAKKSFPMIKDHVMLKYASKIKEADKICRELLSDEILSTIVNLIPDIWLMQNESKANHTETGIEMPRMHEWELSDEYMNIRKSYLHYLTERRTHSDIFVTEIENAG